MINQDWIDHYPDMYANFLTEGSYDHTPYIVSSSKITRGHISFKYINMWGRSGQFLPCVKKIWMTNIEGTSMYQIIKKLKALKPGLRELNKDRFSDIENNNSLLQMYMHKLQEELGVNPNNQAMIRWINEGDANTAFFHGAIKSRRMKNKVLMVEDVDGHACATTTEIRRAFLHYYNSLLGTSSPTKRVRKTTIQCG
ncbi:uncharacterized protein LOC141640290 [Silene latifolia]|uniref:uncharacterized protein LOC141640290 n=1 Tax=Silene latifolia TaxID=37657 RepID=UPI003D789282